MVEIVITSSFKKSFKKIKNKDLKIRIKKQILKIIESPEIGKPLKYSLKNERTLYIKQKKK